MWPKKSPEASEGLDSIAGRWWIDFGTVVECCCGNLEKGDVVDRGGGGSSGGSWSRQFRQPLACQKERQGLHKVTDAGEASSRGVARGWTVGVKDGPWCSGDPAPWWVRKALVGVESLLVLAERLEMAVVHPSESPSEAVATWLSGADVVGAVVDDLEATLSELAAAAGAATRGMEYDEPLVLPCVMPLVAQFLSCLVNGLRAMASVLRHLVKA